MNVLSLPAILSLTINFSVGLTVLMDRPKSIAHRLFFGFIFAFAVWNLGEILMINAGTLAMAQIGAQLVSLGFFLAPAFFLLITFHFPSELDPHPARWPHGFIIPAVPLFLLVTSYPEPMMKILQMPSLGGIYFHSLPSLRDKAFDTIVIVNLIYLVWGVRNLLLNRRKSSSRHKRAQAILLIIGFLTVELLAAGINLLGSFFLPHRSFFFLTTGLSIIISGFFALTILRYQLVNLNRILRRGLVYSVLSTLILGVYYVLIRHAVLTLSAAFGIHSGFLDGLFILLLVIFIRPIEDNISRLMERVVFTRRIQLRQQIREFNRGLLHYSDFESFLHRLEAFLRSFSGSEQVGIFLRETDSGYMFLYSDGSKARIEFPPESPVFQSFSSNEARIELEELSIAAPHDAMVESLAAMDYIYFLPIHMDGRLMGILALGPKKNGLKYTIDELEFLGSLAGDVSIALSRNLALEEARATEAKLLQAEKLAAMGRMVAGVAHEIRNPLNVISSAAQTLQQKQVAQEERRELLQYIVEETDNLNNLLTDFLKLARPRQPQSQRGKAEELLSSVATAVAERAEKNRVRIITSKVDFEIETDFSILRQVLLNLVINAVEAMPDGGTLALNADLVAGWLKIRVKDSGSGIDQSTQDRLYEPFFTTKENGTGLGLSISYTLVETLGGSLRFRTGKGGTTFTVRIPV